MKSVLILGNGGRESAIIDKFIKDKVQVYQLNEKNYDVIYQFCKQNKISMVFPSPENYLCDGIVDYFKNYINVFGPNRYQSKIEGSKHFSKMLMQQLRIPTPDFKYIKHKLEAKNHLDKMVIQGLDKETIVIKYSGLAKGKGVFIPDKNTNISNMLDKVFANGNEGILIEDRLSGVEVSVLAFCNGKTAMLMPQAQDYKRAYDDDMGPNTGGMGAVCPANVLSTDELLLVNSYMNRVVEHLNYVGVLYAGIMKTTQGFYFLEFNCRFGDPEAQVILPLLNTNLYEIMYKCIHQETCNIFWKKQYSAGVVLSHELYPSRKLDIPVEIECDDDIDKNILIYNANVIAKDGKRYTTGGRVLTMVSCDYTLHDAIRNVYNNLYKIRYEGAYYRRDIGNNIIKHTQDDKQVAIGVLASGKATCIQRLLQTKEEYVKVIISDNKKPELLDLVDLYKKPFLYLPKNVDDDLYYERIVNILRQFGVEHVLLAGFMRIVPKILYEEFNTVNIHPSLLPKYKNMMDKKIYKQIVQNGDRFTGCTLHKVTGNVDEGRIVMQKQHKIQSEDNTDVLRNKIQELEKRCIAEYYCYHIHLDEKIRYDVNIDEGNRFVKSLTSKYIQGGFCSMFTFKKSTLAVSADGCGTKLDLACKYSKLDKIGIDLVAMNVNDLIAGGAKPLFFMDYIAVDRMDVDKCKKIISGVYAGCKMSQCDLVGGETAEMKGIYLKDKMDLAGFAVGEKIYDFPRVEQMNNKCILYGIRSSGVHSNGYTLVRKLLDNGYVYPIEELLQPTKIYIELLDIYKEHYASILGVSHITGGGFHDNLTRILPDNLCYDFIDWEFPEVFKWIQSSSKLTRKEMLNIFNCGYGMVVIASKEIFHPDLTKIGVLLEFAEL